MCPNYFELKQVGNYSSRFRMMHITQGTSISAQIPYMAFVTTGNPNNVKSSYNIHGTKKYFLSIEWISVM